MTHPCYGWLAASPWPDRRALIGDEVGEATATDTPSLGTVVAIYLDGMVELSTGDQVPAADLVLLRRAES